MKIKECEACGIQIIQRKSTRRFCLECLVRRHRRKIKIAKPIGKRYEVFAK